MKNEIKNEIIVLDEKVEIIVFDEKMQIIPAEVFTKSGMDVMLAGIEKVVDKIILEGDVTTPEGRDKIRSDAYKMSKVKGFFEKQKKKLTEDLVAKKGLIDTAGKTAMETTQLWQDKIRQPLTDFEDREKKKIEDCRQRITQIEVFKSLRYESVNQIDDAFKKVQELAKYDWDLFSGKAKTSTEETLLYLDEEKKRVVKQEEDKARLEKLEKEEEKREEEDRKRLQKENEDRIAKEAAEKAKKEAETRALLQKQKDREEAKAREDKLKSEKKAVEKAAEEREEKLIAENKALEVEKAEIRRKGEEAKKKAIEEERKKVEAKRTKDIEDEAKRMANEIYHAKIHNEILKDLMNIESKFKPAADVDVEYCKAIIKAIANGRVRHTGIKY